jgi:hypothetical protein
VIVRAILSISGIIDFREQILGAHRLAGNPDALPAEPAFCFDGRRDSREFVPFAAALDGIPAAIYHSGKRAAAAKK